jgi:hypothetical protein
MSLRASTGLKVRSTVRSHSPPFSLPFSFHLWKGIFHFGKERSPSNVQRYNYCTDILIHLQQLDITTQDACSFYNDVVLHADFGGIAFQASEANKIAAALGGKKAAILQSHGIM